MNEYLEYIKKGKKAELIIRTPQGPMRFFATFESIDEDNIVVSRPRHKHLDFNFEQGQDVELYIYTQGGVFKLNCKLVSCAINQCRLTRASEAERIQRREFIRVSMAIKAILKLKSAYGIKTIEVMSRNISAKGINFFLKEDISNCRQIEARLLFAQGTIVTVAEIIKANPIETQKGRLFDTSLMFISISEKEIDFIVKKCFEYEAQQRRRMLDSEQE